MNHKLLLYLALATLTQCSRCKRDDPAPQPPKDPLSTLPPETQTGARTFGCLINGQAMIAPSYYTVGDWNCPQCLTISGQTGLNGERISIVLSGQLRDGQIFNLIPFNQPTSNANEFVANADTRNLSCDYDGRRIKTGRVNLFKFDPVARIAAGQFSFTLPPPPNGSGCDTLKVTAGRFDIKF